MITVIITLLLSLGQIDTPNDYYNATPEKQEQLNVFVHDIIPD